MKMFYLFALLIGISSSAQPFKVDKISGDTMWHSGFEKLYSKASFSGTIGEQLKVIVSKNNKGYELGLWVQTAKSINFSVTKLMRLKLIDGSIIDLKAAGSGGEDIADNLTGGSSISIFKLDELVVSRLSNNHIVFIRLEGDTMNLEYDIKEKLQDVIMNCIKKVEK